MHWPWSHGSIGLYPTPESTPVACMVASIWQVHGDPDFRRKQTVQPDPFYASFLVGILAAPMGQVNGKVLTKAEVLRRLKKAG